MTQKADDLNEALSSLTQAANDLNTAASGSSDSLLGDLRDINQQMGVIASLIQDEGSRQANAQDHYEDVSDRETLRSQSAGRVSACRNTGAVEGDLNTAGIAGSMAVDLEFDPEDDLTQEGDRSVSFLIQTMAAVFDCVNEGSVTVKKDCAGGIVGLMDLGHGGQLPKLRRCKKHRRQLRGRHRGRRGRGDPKLLEAGARLRENTVWAVSQGAALY